MRNTDNRTSTAYFTYLSVAVIGVFTLWGAWARRWMSDDGLIVLRTVRNLEAGNGPVFNAGERVEANTSTLWQYLIFAARWVTGAPLESVAMWLALALSVAALVWASLATARLYGGLVVPAGALIYIALPPARDFFTSGLEWGLALFYLAGLWALLLWWATPRNAGRHYAGRGDYAAAAPYVLAFWAGLSWLVRPEFALYGGVVGIAVLWAHPTWRGRAGILAVALPLPAGYQIFRMGYYGLLTPHTAVAKSAADAAWGSGFAYLRDFVGPYWLWLPLLAVAGAGYFALRGRLGGRRTAAVAIMVGCALVHFIYVLRVGGDFMHGRMLLLPLFALLLPVMLLPVSAARGGLIGLAVSAGIAVWALVVVLRGHPVDWDYFRGNDINIVDEREFWTYSTQRSPGDPPKDTADFYNARVLRGYPEAIGELEDGDAIAYRYYSEEDEAFDWTTVPRAGEGPATLYFINMGMTSMIAPLDVRVLDTIGLATPLAARQPRLEDGRIGHDKYLSREWQAAQSPADLDELPSWIDADEAKLARRALATPTFQRLAATYTAPLTRERFFDNIAWSLGEGRTLQLSANPRDYLDGAAAAR